MNGATTGGVRTLLRLEGFCVMLVALLSYSHYGMGWKVFAIFFFAPDLAFFGYFAGPSVGACIYNAAHSYIGATFILVLGFVFGFHVAVVAGMIWCAHIGFNRLLGYGLKYSCRVGMTHLGLIGEGRQGMT